MSMIGRLRSLAAGNPDCCREIPLQKSRVGDSALTGDDNGFPISALLLRDPIENAHDPNRIPVLVTAGLTREWVPPDALIEWAELLVTARTQKAPIVYPKFSFAGVTYENDENPEGAPYVVPFDVVERIFATFELILLPMANPDGRWYSMTQLHEDPDRGMWRKNRAHSAPSGECVGVDLNRNFPVGWHWESYFRPGIARTRADSTDASCENNYRGPAAGSEVETQNIVTLFKQFKPRGFVDIHMTGRTVTYPWAVENNQFEDTDQNYRNEDWNDGGSLGGRDGFAGTAYGEFMWPALAGRLLVLGMAMADEIEGSAGVSPLARKRSRYDVLQSTGSTGRNETYPGCADDYAFSRQFEEPDEFGSCVAFTIECGMAGGQNPDNEFDDEGDFTPHYSKIRPKIGREVHAGLFGLLKDTDHWPPPDPPEDVP